MPRPAHCLICGRSISQKRRGRPRYYCSEACKAKAYRIRKKQASAQQGHREVAMVEVLYCPEGLYSRGEFYWQDFQESLAVWPDGMQVSYRGQRYEIRDGELKPLPGEGC